MKHLRDRRYRNLFASIVLVLGASLSYSGELAVPATNLAPVEITGQPSAPPSLSPSQRGVLLEASLALEAGEHDRAVAILRALLAREPDLAPPKQMLVAALTKAGQEQESKAAFEQFLPEMRGDFSFMNNYAWFLVTAQDPAYRNPPLALELVREAILLAPNVYQIWSTLAEVHYWNGNFERSAQAMRQTLMMATRAQASPEVLKVYEASLRKMLEAQAVMSLIE